MTGVSAVQCGVGQAFGGAGGYGYVLGVHTSRKAARRHEARERMRSMESRGHCFIRARTGSSCMTITMVKRSGLFGGPLLGVLCYSLLPSRYATAPGEWVAFTPA